MMSDNPNEIGPASAAQERVTAEELTKAIAQIEMRKESEAHRLVGTLSIGQAVEELDLDASPEELFAEVQAERKKARTVLAEQLQPEAASAAPLRTVAASEVWPPPPGPQNAPSATMPTPLTHCPACERKLLTQASALCNWCGAKIDDPKYQERAAQSRVEQDQAERRQIEAVVQEEARYGIFGRLKRRGKQNPGGSGPTLG